MFTPYSVQCFTPRTGLPIGSSPLGNALHYVVKVLVACSAYYRWARSLYSAHLLILPTILGYLLRIKADCWRFVTHHTQSVSGGQTLSGVGFLTALLSPSPPTAKSDLAGVPRSSDGHGHHLDSEFLLARLFCPEQLAYWNAVSLPITLDKLVRLQTITNQGITTILGADRTALDLILNQNART
jgi:hypothetical protein